MLGKCYNHEAQPFREKKGEIIKEHTMTKQMPHMKPEMREQRRTATEKRILSKQNERKNGTYQKIHSWSGQQQICCGKDVAGFKSGLLE